MSNAETKAISAVLKDKQIHVLMQANPDKLFSTHKDIWEFIRDYASQNGSVPPEELVVENFRDYTPVQSVGTTKHHLGELQSEFMDTTVREILRTAAGKVQEGDVNSAVDDLITGVNDLKKTTSAVKDIDLIDGESAIDHFLKIQEMNRNGGAGIKTGLHGFDAVLPGGITGGMFGIVLAYPAIGKSFLALYFAVQAWKQGKVPLVLSLEMSEAEVRNRVYAILGEGIWSLRNLSAGDVELDTFKKWHKKVFKDMPPFYIVSTDGIGEVNTSVIRSKIDQYKPDFVVFDYMQLGVPDQKSDNETVKMKNLSRELKLLAMSSRVPIIAISSATPGEGANLSEPPTLGQTAWSKQMAYDADFMLALGREQNGDTITAVFRKNRNGPLNELYIETDFDSGRFRYVDSGLVS
jgi:replicative DNA helicase